MAHHASSTNHFNLILASCVDPPPVDAPTVAPDQAGRRQPPRSRRARRRGRERISIDVGCGDATKPHSAFHANHPALKSASRCSGSSTGPESGCPCEPGIDNFCDLAPKTAGCDATFPGGYCDPDGDGSY